MKHAFITTDLEIKRLGENVRLARKRRKMTTTELASRAQVSRPVVARIEKGDPGVGIANVFNVLGALGLLNGLAALTDPETDRAQAQHELLELRKSSRANTTTLVSKTFGPRDLDF